ncbi:MAG: flagellar hook assembly protein FlgD [Pseudomonadota bacterium]
MATSSVTSPLAGLPATTTTGTPASAAPVEDANASADRFLKLLVAQMQNQDPLNPMDNAQVTSQMAQINTVNGIEKLNSGLQGLSSQFMQLQVMQGTALVGRDVVVPGNHVAVAEGVGRGGFELAGSASTVKVEIKSTTGQVIDTIELGAHGAGVHTFDWDASKAAGIDPANLRFKVTAATGGVSKEASPLMMDRVNSISTSGKALNLELAISGSVAYSDVKAFN